MHLVAHRVIEFGNDCLHARRPSKLIESAWTRKSDLFVGRGMKLGGTSLRRSRNRPLRRVNFPVHGIFLHSARSGAPIELARFYISGSRRFFFFFFSFTKEHAEPFANSSPRTDEPQVVRTRIKGRVFAEDFTRALIYPGKIRRELTKRGQFAKMHASG